MLEKRKNLLNCCNTFDILLEDVEDKLSKMDIVKKNEVSKLNIFKTEEMLDK